MADEATMNGDNGKRSAEEQQAAAAKRRKRSNVVETDADWADQDDDDEMLSQEFDGTQSSSEPPAGTILEIHVWDFMCHRSLQVPMYPRVNFVCGKNGSGKSAIVAALIVGLGGHASITDRGNLVKLIREGSNEAKIKITIRNTGTEAYRPADYGDAIIVERTLRKMQGNGTTQCKSTCTLKSQDGKTVAKHKSDLHHLLDHFSIQVDNPVCVLTQETARRFLNTSSPRDKFSFFMRATLLAQLEDDYDKCDIAVSDMGDTLEMHQETLKMSEEELKVKKARVRACNRVKDMQTELENVRGDLIWATICAKEAEAEQVKKQITDYKNASEKAQPRLEERQGQLSELQKSMVEHQQEATQFENEISELQGRHESLLKAMAAHKGFLKRAKKTHATVKNSLSQATQNKVSIENRLNDARNQALKASQKANDERARKIQAKEDELEAARAKVGQLREDVSQYEAAAERANEDAKNAEGALRRAEADIRSIDGRIRMLRQSSSNLALLHAKMPQLVNAINQERGWHKKPIGPIANCIRVKDEKFSHAVERALIRDLTSFCIDNQHDLATFKAICNRLSYRPFTIVTKFTNELYREIGQDRAQSRQPTVFDVIEINHPHVTNCLVNMSKIHQTLLYTDRDTAKHEMLTHKTAVNCSRAFTIDGDEWHGGAAPRVYACRDKKKGLLGVDVKRAVQDLEEQRGQIEANIGACRSKVDLAKRAVAEKRKAITQGRKLVSNQHKVVTTLERELNDLRQDDDDDLMPDLNDLEKELTQAEQEETQLVQQVSKAEEELNKVKGVVPDSSEIDTLTATIGELSAKLESSHAQMEGLDQNVAKLNKKIARLKGMIEDNTKVVTELKEKQAALEEEISKGILDAEQLGYARRQVRSSPEKIESKLSALQKQVEKAQEEHGDPTVIHNDYDKAKTAYDDKRRQLESLTNFRDKLSEAVQARISHSKKLRRFLQDRVAREFRLYLRRKNFDGQMDVDFLKRELLISVRVDASRTGEMTGVETNTKSLSGGEKSYSTLCFVLSLWGAMGSCFHCMDEFDVFMDSQTRLISVDTLMRFAAQQPRAQLILLTPLTLPNNVSSHQEVKIFRLTDPRQRQLEEFAPASAS